MVRIRRVEDGVDRYGQPIWATQSTSLPDAVYAPGAMVESRDVGREPVVIAPTLYWRKQWPDVVASDRLTTGGVTYQVIGFPQQWRGMHAGGLVVQLRAVEEEEA